MEVVNILYSGNLAFRCYKYSQMESTMYYAVNQHDTLIYYNVRPKGNDQLR